MFLVAYPGCSRWNTAKVASLYIKDLMSDISIPQHFFDSFFVSAFNNGNKKQTLDINTNR